MGQDTGIDVMSGAGTNVNSGAKFISRTDPGGSSDGDPDVTASVVTAKSDASDIATDAPGSGGAAGSGTSRETGTSG